MAPSSGIELHHSVSSDSTNNTILSTGRINVRLSILPFLSVEPTSNFTVRTNHFLSGKVLITFASFHSFHLQLSSFKITMFSCWKFCLVDDHFCLSCNNNKNSLRHRLQNLLLKCCTLLHRFLQEIPGRLNSPGGSIITSDFIVKRSLVILLHYFTSLMVSTTRGLEFTIASISVKKVFSVSSSKLVLHVFRIDESVARADLICLSHTPPM